MSHPICPIYHRHFFSVRGPTHRGWPQLIKQWIRIHPLNPSLGMTKIDIIKTLLRMMTRLGRMDRIRDPSHLSRCRYFIPPPKHRFLPYVAHPFSPYLRVRFVLLRAQIGALRDEHPGAPLITFSHFLPRPELLPEKRFLTLPTLAKAVGSRFLNERVRRLSPDVHVFGHTHFGWDATIEGVRYMQAAQNLRFFFSPPRHPFLPYVAPHFSHISPFITCRRRFAIRENEPRGKRRFACARPSRGVVRSASTRVSRRMRTNRITMRASLISRTRRHRRRCSSTRRHSRLVRRGGRFRSGTTATGPTSIRASNGSLS